MKRCFPRLWMLSALWLLPATCALPAASEVVTSHATLTGIVSDAQGTPQMGALVEVLAADATVIARSFTDSHGRYLMSAVVPGKYSLRASAAFFAPALRDHLQLRGGAQAIVNLTMSTVFELGAWFPAESRRANAAADDWKWTLRSTSTRPLLRLDDHGGDDASLSSSGEHSKTVSSETRLAVTSGDGSFGRGGLHQAVATTEAQGDGDAATLSVDLGTPVLPFTGAPSSEISAGYEKRSAPGTATRLVASYSAHPEVGNSVEAGVETVRLASAQRMQLGDMVQIDAGTLMLAEKLAATHLQSAPFLRVEVRPGSAVVLTYRYARAREVQNADDLDQLRPSVVALSDVDGTPLSTFGTHHEFSATARLSDRDVLELGLYTGSVDHAVLNGSGALDRADMQGQAIIVDPSTATYRLAGAGYRDRGMSAVVSHSLTPALTAMLACDYGMTLERMVTDPATLSTIAAELRATAAPAASVSLRGKVLRTGTAIRAQYRWQPHRVVTQVNSYNVANDDAYLSLHLRQRIQVGRLLPNGLEAVVQAANLLEQGYQPVLSADGHTLFLADVPRSVQGGLSFTF